MSKGIIGLPPIIIKGAFVAVVVLGIMAGGANSVNTFVKQEALSINANRISTTALALNSADNSTIGMEISNFQIRQEQDNITLKHREEKATVKITGFTGFKELEAPQEWREIDEETLCLKSRNATVINISTGEC